MAGNRWLGLAVIAALALIAQPAAVVDGTIATATTGDEDTSDDCRLPVEAPSADGVPVTDLPDLSEAEDTACEAKATVDETAVSVDTSALDGVTG